MTTIAEKNKVSVKDKKKILKIARKLKCSTVVMDNLEKINEWHDGSVGYGYFNECHRYVRNLEDLAKLFFESDVEAFDLEMMYSYPSITEHPQQEPRLDLLEKAMMFILRGQRNQVKSILTHLRKIELFMEIGRYYNPLSISTVAKLKLDDGLKYYVYSYLVDGEVKYIGEGTFDYRWARAVSINQHNKQCLKHHTKITIDIIDVFESKKEAMQYESKLIAEYGLDNLWNRKG